MFPLWLENVSFANTGQWRVGRASQMERRGEQMQKSCDVSKLGLCKNQSKGQSIWGSLKAERGRRNKL
jgi:hypothetical protein